MTVVVIDVVVMVVLLVNVISYIYTQGSRTHPKPSFDHHVPSRVLLTYTTPPLPWAHLKAGVRKASASSTITPVTKPPAGVLTPLVRLTAERDSEPVVGIDLKHKLDWSQIVKTLHSILSITTSCVHIKDS